PTFRPSVSAARSSSGLSLILATLADGPWRHPGSSGPSTYSSVALRSDGTVWNWGANDDGHGGTGVLGTNTAPVQVAGPNGVGVLTALQPSPAGTSTRSRGSNPPCSAEQF